MSAVASDLHIGTVAHPCGSKIASPVRSMPLPESIKTRFWIHLDMEAMHLRYSMCGGTTRIRT